MWTVCGTVCALGGGPLHPPIPLLGGPGVKHFFPSFLNARAPSREMGRWSRATTHSTQHFAENMGRRIRCQFYFAAETKTTRVLLLGMPMAEAPSPCRWSAPSLAATSLSSKTPLLQDADVETSQSPPAHLAWCAALPGILSRTCCSWARLLLRWLPIPAPVEASREQVGAPACHNVLVFGACWGCGRTDNP